MVWVFLLQFRQRCIDLKPSNSFRENPEKTQPHAVADYHIQVNEVSFRLLAHVQKRTSETFKHDESFHQSEVYLRHDLDQFGRLSLTTTATESVVNLQKL